MLTIYSFPLWTFNCDSKSRQCIRELLEPASTNGSKPTSLMAQGQNGCEMLCAPEQLFWPKPSGPVSISDSLFKFVPGKKKKTLVTVRRLKGHDLIT